MADSAPPAGAMTYDEPPPPYPGVAPTGNPYPPMSGPGSPYDAQGQGQGPPPPGFMPPQAGYPPQGAYGGFAPPQTGYPQQPGGGSDQTVIVHHHPTPPAPPGPQQVVHVVKTGNCPQCQAGVIIEDFTCAGLCLGIFFFPCGLLCCLAMRQKRCNQCGANF